MAKVVFQVFMVMLCMVLLPQHSSSCGQQGCCLDSKVDVQKIQNRRLLYGIEMKKKVVLTSGVVEKDGPKTRNVENGDQKKNETVVGWGLGLGLGWELREAPMGPDPMHHTGAPPKKPRTTP